MVNEWLILYDSCQNGPIKTSIDVIMSHQIFWHKIGRFKAGIALFI
jgi:hypothetical protein